MAVGQRGGFGARLLLSHVLVILAGGTTLLVVALGLAPGMFRDHVERAVGPVTAELATHLDIAFSRAIMISLGVAVAIATVTAMAVGWFVSQRAARPLRQLADAASAVAAGDYAVRIDAAGYGAEFDALAEAFRQMATNIDRTERTRARVLRDLAHELRTPLSTVRGYHEAVADGILPATPANFQRVAAEISRIERLVDDVARVSRAEERALDLHVRQVAVGDLVRAGARAAASRYEARGVLLGVQTEAVEADAVDPSVLVDPDRIQEVLANLLDNALRHTPAGGSVLLSAQPIHGGFSIIVRDTGDGIDAEDLPRVFERFFRVDDGRSRAAGGSGIGLAIARALTQAHGGRIRAQSAGRGHGATFEVTLPRAGTLVRH